LLVAGLVAGLVGAAILGACGTSGTELRDPPPGATAPRPTTTTTSTSTPIAPAVFSVNSSAFTPGGALPGNYTCDAGVSPPLSWSAIPPATVELALTITNPVDDRPVHWIVAGIDPTSTGIQEDTVPLNAVEGPNSDGDFGWWAPCPPVGETVTLDITLYALEEPSALTPEMTPPEALEHLGTVPGTRTVSTVTVTGT
jgi:phosphatidylethanolamine-binding protein (PEBP) family uncharacterized protein